MKVTSRIAQVLGSFARHNRASDQRVTLPLSDTLSQADAQSEWTPTHRHRKGGLYRVLGSGIIEADRVNAIIYDDRDGTVWVRPASEFNDGRFEPMA